MADPAKDSLLCALVWAVGEFFLRIPFLNKSTADDCDLSFESRLSSATRSDMTNSQTDVTAEQSDRAEVRAAIDQLVVHF